ncbi:hypothetical protein ACFYPT_41560 [Streptomyces sp. NPDC005529]|uniref:hypothetical protein n=1 Tax=unclassified Streptomyces TaxID=2593676 RepID=UPI0033B45A5C
MNGADAFRALYPQAGWMVDGLETSCEDPNAIVKRVVDNVVGSGFRWSGRNAGSLLSGASEGDCFVLASGCVEALNVLLAPVPGGGATSLGEYTERILVSQPWNSYLLDGQKPNVDETMWYFENHYWLTSYDGACIDVLFSGNLLDTSSWLRHLGDRTTLEGAVGSVFQGEDSEVTVYVARDGYRSRYCTDIGHALLMPPRPKRGTGTVDGGTCAVQ